jgi:predicted unusual protein kinase regulating ubiquinone biosynthesis (AarF/ABC1/UbiB family)
MTDDIAKISKDYIFVIPPYFALILRAFSVLEGIGLEVDPDYSIVNACYPYLSKRLLTDDRWVNYVSDATTSYSSQLSLASVKQEP